MKLDKLSLAWIVPIGAILVIIPLVPVDLFRFLVTFIFILLWHVVLASSYDLVGGQMGYINLGHAAFFGIGGYTFGILQNSGLFLGFSFIGALAAAVIFAAAMSVPFFRLRGPYFALASFALVVLLELVATNLREVTGGAHGLYIKPGFRDVPAYYAALAIAVGIALTNFFIARSGFGLALASIREDEEVARVFGIRPFKYKALALMISASFAGLIGAVFMWQANYADPKMMFGLEKSLIPVVMAMVGGSGTVMGPIVGALFLTVIEEFLWSQMPYLHLAAYGVILALVGLFLPGGIIRVGPVLVRRVRNILTVRDR